MTLTDDPGEMIVGYHGDRFRLIEVEPRVRIVGWGTFADLSSAIRAGVFGQMVKRANGTVIHYQSDLYHDAQWIEKHVSGATTFFFKLREWGTHIGSDGAVVWGDLDHSERLYRVVLDSVNNGEWFVWFCRYRREARQPLARTA